MERVQAIGEINHHIRNGLETITNPALDALRSLPSVASIMRRIGVAS